MTEPTIVGGWTREGEAMVREWTFPDFAAALAFVLQVAAVSEKANHHPDIDIRYNRVRLLLTSHDAGTVTARDMALAEQIDGLL